MAAHRTLPALDLRTVIVALFVVSGAARSASAETPRVAVHDPFVLGDKALPAKRGELGPVVGERPAESGHPAPRVIVDVLDARGMKKKDAEAAARAGSWSKIVGCYRRKAWAEPDLSVDTKLRLGVRGGTIRTARAMTAKKKKDVVASCLADALLGVAMPKSKRGADVTIRVRVYPGDDPVPPPEDVVERGEGKIDLARVRTVVEAASTELRSCHDAALGYAPKLWGDIAVRFRVGEDGRVLEAFEVGGPFPEDRVTRCVLRQARALRFDAPQGGWVRFVVPLTLHP